MTTLSFTRRSALRLIAAGFAFRPKMGLSLFEDVDDVKDVHSAVLEHTQKHFEGLLEEEYERAKATRKVYKKMREPEKVNFKLLVVAGETSCTCWLADSGPFYARGPMDSAELAEHYRFHHQLQPSFTVSKPYVVAPSKVLEPAYQNRRAYADKYWQFEEEYPGCGGTYFQLVRSVSTKKRRLRSAKPVTGARRALFRRLLAFGEEQGHINGSRTVTLALHHWMNLVSLDRTTKGCLRG